MAGGGVCFAFGPCVVSRKKRYPSEDEEIQERRQAGTGVGSRAKGPWCRFRKDRHEKRKQTNEAGERKKKERKTSEKRVRSKEGNETTEMKRDPKLSSLPIEGEGFFLLITTSL